MKSYKFEFTNCYTLEKNYILEVFYNEKSYILKYFIL